MNGYVCKAWAAHTGKSVHGLPWVGQTSADITQVSLATSLLALAVYPARRFALG